MQTEMEEMLPPKLTKNLFFLQNNVTIVTTQDSYLIISCLRVTLEAFSNVT